jgi:hypothetical protein
MQRLEVSGEVRHIYVNRRQRVNAEVYTLLRYRDVFFTYLCTPDDFNTPKTQDVTLPLDCLQSACTYYS